MQTNPDNSDVLMILVPIGLSIIGSLMLMGGPANAYHDWYLLARDVAYDALRMARSLF